MEIEGLKALHITGVLDNIVVAMDCVYCGGRLRYRPRGASMAEACEVAGRVKVFFDDHKRCTPPHQEKEVKSE